MKRASQRILGIVTTGMLSVALVVWLSAREVVLEDTAYVSGWLLAAVLAALTIYNLRKKLPYPPLLRSSTWLTVHIYTGLLSVVVFALHVGWRRPTGTLEVALTVLFASTTFSGLMGLWLSRVLPPRVAGRGHEVLFERIPTLRRQLREKAEGVVVACTGEADLTTLAEFYERGLKVFFSRPANLWKHLLQSSRPLHAHLEELRRLDRYLSEPERRASGELVELIEAKHTLDYRFAMQGLLKAWLFVHIPVTYGLWVLVFVHATLAHAFSMGAR